MGELGKTGGTGKAVENVSSAGILHAEGTKSESACAVAAAIDADVAANGAEGAVSFC